MEKIQIKDIEPNKGQIAGLPPNPRKISTVRLNALMKSISENPEFLNYRGLLVVPHGGKYVLIGGNMRYKALLRLGYKEVPCEIIPPTTPIEDLAAYVIKDNAGYGEWDFSSASVDWAAVGVDFDAAGVDFKEEGKAKRKGWHDGREKTDEPLCDLNECVTIHRKGEFMYLTSFAASKEGYPLSEIKADTKNVKVFAASACSIIRGLIGIGKGDGWCVVGMPKRRHKEWNFGESVCAEIAAFLGVNYYPDAIICESRQRINPRFTLNADVAERNVLLYDDIITTGATITAARKLFADKNVLVVIGIWNN